MVILYQIVCKVLNHKISVTDLHTVYGVNLCVTVSNYRKYEKFDANSTNVTEVCMNEQTYERKDENFILSGNFICCWYKNNVKSLDLYVPLCHI